MNHGFDILGDGEFDRLLVLCTCAARIPTHTRSLRDQSHGGDFEVAIAGHSDDDDFSVSGELAQRRRARGQKHMRAGLGRVMTNVPRERES